MKKTISIVVVLFVMLLASVPAYAASPVLKTNFSCNWYSDGGYHYGVQSEDALTSGWSAPYPALQPRTVFDTIDKAGVRRATKSEITLIQIDAPYAVREYFLCRNAAGPTFDVKITNGGRAFSVQVLNSTGQPMGILLGDKDLGVSSTYIQTFEGGPAMMVLQTYGIVNGTKTYNAATLIAVNR